MFAYSLDNFTREVADVVARSSDPKVVTDVVSELLRRLLSAAFFLPPELLAADPQGFARHDLHRDPEGRFQVAIGVWSPGASTSIHDHPSWGVIGAYQHRILSTAYRRLDDRATAGFASLSESCRTLVTEVSFALVRPPEEEIHRLENPFPATAVTVHVFGPEGTAQNCYDLKAKSLMAVEQPQTLGI